MGWGDGVVFAVAFGALMILKTWTGRRCQLGDDLATAIKHASLRRILTALIIPVVNLHEVSLFD